MIVNINNCHETIINYIEENNIEINNYEDMKNTYVTMVGNHYYFVIERDLISDILIDLTFVFVPTAVNRGRIIATIDMEDDNSILDDTDYND
tara:strand:+ start:198 stop:473 length:276 start_codon:yes stop_codon:yes gene_type:complete